MKDAEFIRFHDKLATEPSCAPHQVEVMAYEILYARFVNIYNVVDIVKREVLVDVNEGHRLGVHVTNETQERLPPLRLCSNS